MITHTPDSKKIYYHTTSTGPALLLVHGGLPDYSDPLVDLLSPQYRCIAFDRLGFGRAAQMDRNTTVE